MTVEGLQTGVASGVVTQVRRYQGGTFRYGVRLDKDGVLMDEVDLRATGKREPIASYLPPSTVFPWDEVEIQMNDRVERGVVDGWFDNEGTTMYTIWMPAAGESVTRSEDEIVRVGTSATRRRGTARSTRVDTSGEVLGTEEYEILEDLMDLVADSRPDGR